MNDTCTINTLLWNMQCYTQSAPFFLVFVKAEESYDVAAAITFDIVDEGSNNRPWGDLALRFQQRSGVQDAGIHPKATASRPGSVWPACVNFSSHCSAEHTETNDRMGGTVPTLGSTNGAPSSQRTRRWCNVFRKLEHVFRISRAAVAEANNRLWL